MQNSSYGAPSSYLNQGPTSPATSGQIPIRNILNDDGTLNLQEGMYGSVDITGYQLQSGLNGQPRFISLEQPVGDPNDSWKTFPDLCNYTWGVINELESDGEAIYAGGIFSRVKTKNRFSIGRWNGHDWDTLGPKLIDYNKPEQPLGVVNAITIFNQHIYVGGSFSHAGTLELNNIAKWDGNTWSALGSGLSGTVSEILVTDSTVYVSGYFSHAGKIEVNQIAKWDGEQWTGLGSGFNNAVHALAIFKDDLYAGGAFTKAGDVSVNRIAKWDGSSWSALGNGVQNVVRALAADSGYLYSGGDFIESGGIYTPYISKWDGENWSAMGSGFDYGVHELKFFDGELHAIGGMTRSGGVSMKGVAKWDGNNWSAVVAGLSGSVYSAMKHKGKLFLGANGIGYWIHGVKGYFVAWDYPGWDFLCPGALGVDGPINNVFTIQNDIVVSGTFNFTGTYLGVGLAKWDGELWKEFSDFKLYDNDVPFRTVKGMAVMGNDVYMGGSFKSTNGSKINNIAKWNGNEWILLSSGFNSGVFAIAVEGNNLYAGGHFTKVGEVLAHRIVKWDGTTWTNLGTGADVFNIFSLAVFGSDLYAGGYFTSIGGAPSSHIAKWNGSTWEPLGTGTNGTVRAIVKYEDQIYIGGDFTIAGGTEVNYIAKWDGEKWNSLDGGLNGPVHALTLHSDRLFAGGQFTMTHNALTVNHIGQWDGEQWSELGSGTNGTVYGLSPIGNRLFVGGEFSIAGGKPSLNAAEWDVSGATSTNEFEFSKISIYPNPASDFLMVDLTNLDPNDIMIELFGIDGRLISNHMEEGSKLIRLNIHSIPAGTYILKVSGHNYKSIKKFIISR